jgi:hypothetical protein
MWPWFYFGTSGKHGTLRFSINKSCHPERLFGGWLRTWRFGKFDIRKRHFLSRRGVSISPLAFSYSTPFC